VGLAAAVLACIVAAASPARAAVAPIEGDRAGALGAIDGYFAALNRADWAAAQTFYAPSMTVLDDDPPYTYAGNAAGTRFLEHATAPVAGFTFTRSAPWYLTFRNDVLYVVFPTSAKVELKTGEVVYKNGFYSFVVRRFAGSWKIAGMAWAVTSLGAEIVG
jgi:ketosteroid isomerase-like protein